MCGKLGHIIFTWGKCGDKKDEKHPLSTSVHKPSSALFTRCALSWRDTSDTSNCVKLKRHVQDSTCQWSEVNVELHAVLHCAESVAAIWMANAFGSGVPGLWEEHGFALRLFLASSVIQWPLLVILRCFCSHQLPSHDLVAVTDCISEDAQNICDSCDAKIPLYVVATVPFTMHSGCDVKKLIDLMMEGQEFSQVAAQTCDLVKRHVLPGQISQLPADVTPARCMEAILCVMEAHLSSPGSPGTGCVVLEELGVESTRKRRETHGTGGRCCGHFEGHEKALQQWSRAKRRLRGADEIDHETPERLEVSESWSRSGHFGVHAKPHNQRRCAKVGLSGLGKLGREPWGKSQVAWTPGSWHHGRCHEQRQLGDSEEGPTASWKVGGGPHRAMRRSPCFSESATMCQERRALGRGWVRWFIFFRFCGWPRKPCRQKLVLDGMKGPWFVAGAAYAQVWIGKSREAASVKPIQGNANYGIN